MRSMRFLLLAGGLLASAPAAQAQFPAGFGGNFCGGNAFTTCATFSVSLAGNVVTLKVKNTSGDAASFFTAIGISNLGAGVSATTFSFVNTAGTTSNWTLGTPPNGLSGAGIIQPAVGGDAANPTNVGNTLNNGEEVTFTFTLTGTYNLSNVQFALHDQGGSPNVELCSSSTKLVVSRTSPTSGVWAANSPPSQCADVSDPSTSMPEPATMGLLALGLVGMGGAGLIRRRRKA